MKYTGSYNYVLTCLVLAVSFPSCKSSNDTSGQKFTSATTIPMIGTIPSGKILAKSDIDETTLGQQIFAQLKFTTGILNGFETATAVESYYSGAPDHTRTKLNGSIVKGEDAEDKPGYSYYEYSATMYFAFPIAKPPFDHVEGYRFNLPLQTDEEGLQSFYERYANSPHDSDANKEYVCSGKKSEDFAADEFWYYYRPFGPCTLTYLREGENGSIVKSERADLPSDVAAIEIILKKDEVATPETESYPEYSEIWKDGRFKGVLVFAHLGEGSFGHEDSGYKELQNTWSNLTGQSGLGQPVSLSLVDLSTAPDAIEESVKHISAKFEGIYGPIELEILYVSSIKDLGSNADYMDAIKDADYIAINSHSGYGSELAGYAQIGGFTAEQYKIVHINASDSIVSIGNGIYQEHKTLNAGDGRFLDFIVNANANRVNDVSTTTFQSVMHFSNMLTSFMTYTEALPNFQSTVVLYDEDNSFRLAR